MASSGKSDHTAAGDRASSDADGTPPWVDRDRILRFFDEDIVITQRFGGPLGDHLVWDAALTMCSYLSSSNPPGDRATAVVPRTTWMHKRILELGSGAGTVGITLSKCLQNCHIVLTDLPPVLPLLQHNVAQNQKREILHAAEMAVEPLSWGDSPQAQEQLEHMLSSHGPVDIVLMSDCVYPKQEEWSKLLFTMREICRQQPLRPPVFVICQELRSKEDAQFFVEAQRFFQLQRIPPDSIPVEYRAEEIAILLATIKAT